MASKLNGRNSVDALNAWAVSVVRYSAGIVKWRKDEMKEMDRKTRKIICIRELMDIKKQLNYYTVNSIRKISWKFFDLLFSYIPQNSHSLTPLITILKHSRKFPAKLLISLGIVRNSRLIVITF